MNFLECQKNNISRDDLELIVSLIKIEYKPFESPFDFELNKKLNILFKKFQVSCFEELARKAIFYKIINVDISSDYLNYINKYSNKRFKVKNKFRKEFIKIILNTPEKVNEFCSNWKNDDKKALKAFCDDIKNDSILKKYVQNAHKLWLKYLIETRCEYRNIVSILFETDDEYENNAFKLGKKTRYFVLECVYQIINFIANNFPITINRIYTEQEKHLIKFLLFRADEIEYMKKYNISFEELEKLYSSICENFNCSSINQVLSLIVIEKYIRKENISYINSLLNIQSLNVKTGFLKEIIGDIDENILKDKKSLFEKITLNKCNLLES